MPVELAAMIPPRDRLSCRETMIGYINWKIDRGSAQASVEHCLSLALGELSTRRTADASKLRALARAFRNMNRRTNLTGNDMIAARDRAMADQLQTFRRGLKRGSKIIVWTANAHAAYGGLPTGETLAQIARKRIGSKIFTVGFSAAAGEYRWSRSEVRQVPASAPNALENRILADRPAAVASRAQLQKFGTIPGTALSWHKPLTTDWASLFDALYVIAREEPTMLVEAQ
jgi:erythromycin esterase-like protein